MSRCVSYCVVGNIDTAMQALKGWAPVFSEESAGDQAVSNHPPQVYSEFEPFLYVCVFTSLPFHCCVLILTINASPHTHVTIDCVCC